MCIRDRDYPTTIASPKKYLLPAKETLFEFDAERNEVTDYADEVRPRVLFGVHACDINGLANLSSVFNDPRYPDPYYAAHAAATLIVGVACMPSANCFCNLMDAEEAVSYTHLYLIVKIVATAIVMVYNFVTRKIFLDGDTGAVLE